jgi:ABC-2 type transport system permease protein
MIQDIFTVAWKEWKEIFHRGKGLSGGKSSMIIMVACFGIIMPLQFGIQWVKSPASIAMWAWIPLFMVGSVVADSFAGERERRTLETLLASRLPDSAILLGKTLAAIGYGWGLSMACLIVGVVAMNIVHWSGHVVVYSATNALAILVVSFMISTLSALAGILISIRAATVKQALQQLNIGILVLWFGMIFGLKSLLPKGVVKRVMEGASSSGVSKVVLFGVFALVALDILLYLLARARFRRARLILD